MQAEVETYLTMIEDLRKQVQDMVAGLPAEALNWRPLPGDDHATNSLAVLVAHVAGAEHFWIAEVVGGMPATRDRPAEFTTEVDDPASLMERLDQVGIETRGVLSSLSEDELASTRSVRGKTVSVRWAILHVIDHTALHLGHMQLTFQLWSQGEGQPGPRWFERLS